MTPLAAQKLNLPANLSIHRASARLDPTRTLTLRNRFEAQMKRRFADLKRAIRRVVVDEDSFNLNPAPGQVGRLITQANFDFPTSEGKKNAFMAWLKQQEEQGILETMHLPRIGQAIEPAWTDTFIKDSYQRGVQRARYELTGAGYPVPTLAETGGLVASMSTPFHIERLGVCYSRCFDQLRGITSQMDAQISHILAQGIADGDNPILLAKKMVAVIDGTGAGTLGITDSLGRFIPAERRARMLARTEVVRAHHLAMIQEYENWAVEGVKVVAEWVTAGFKVCPQCQEIARNGPYTLEKVKYMLPAHPHCRCVAVPEPAEEKGRGRGRGAKSVEEPPSFGQADISSIVNLSGGVNNVQLVNFVDDTKGVFKSEVGESAWVERKTLGSKEFSLAEREVAAYKISQELGLGDLVPNTVMAEISGEKGSLQAFVEGAKGIDELGKNLVAGLLPDDYYKMAVFDYLIGNTDRHLGNILLDHMGNLRLIDNGLSFPIKSGEFRFKPSGQYIYNYGDPLSEPGYKIWPRFEQSVSAEIKNQLSSTIKSFDFDKFDIPEKQLKAMKSRAKELIKAINGNELGLFIENKGVYW